MKKHILFFSLVISTSLYSQSWNTTGNSGTNPSTNFIGTTDDQSLVFKINNAEKMRLTTNGRLVFFSNNSQTFSNNLYIGGGNEIPSNNAGGVNWGNVSVGLGSMSANSTGNANTALGFNSLASNTSGGANTVIGTNSMRYTIIGTNNVGTGVNTLSELVSGNHNTAIGTTAMMGRKDFNGNFNTALGLEAIRNIYRGNYNTILGAKSFRSFHSGSNNIVIGYNNISSYDLVNVNNNIYIGNNISPINSQPNNELNIGNWIFGDNGKISIGGRANFTCADCTDYSLFVKNGIKAEKVKVDIASANGWADYVFKNDYQLKTLEEVEKHINEKGHLPNVPSAQEVAKNGINVAEMDAKLLEKIEELTLYSIEQNKKIKELNEKILKLEKLMQETTTNNIDDKK